jgi:hypothetical protein
VDAYSIPKRDRTGGAVSFHALAHDRQQVRRHHKQTIGGEENDSYIDQQTLV